MNKIHFIKTSVVALAFAGILTACMDKDWDTPSFEGGAPYGNNEMVESNVMTIADFKSRYINGLTKASDTIRIDAGVQLKGRITGNDIQGNIYNEVALQDSTGAILICIQQGGLNGYMAVGQEVLVDVGGLYTGLYGNQPQIGVPYTNSGGNTFPSRMIQSEWAKRFKLIGKPDASTVQAEEFDVNKMQDADYVKSCRGKLMVLKNVKMKDAGKLWAPSEDKDAGNGVSRQVIVNGKASSNLVVRSSSYADFAADTIPSASINLTGIFTVYATNPSRYGYTWQILLRSDKDIQVINN